MAINKLRYYLGPLGNLQPLPPMVGGAVYPDALIHIPGSLHTSLSGRSTLDRTGVPKRSWALTWENLTEADRLLIDALIYRGSGAQLRLIDPRSSNRLPADVSTGGSLSLSTTGFSSNYLVSDTAGTTVSNGWGTTDTGQAWSNGGGSSGDYSKSGGLARHSVGSVGTARASSLIPVIAADFDYTDSFATDKLAAGNPQATTIYARHNGTTTFYQARVQLLVTGLLFTELFRVVAGTPTLIGSATTTIAHIANARYNRRVQFTGSLLRVKIWPVASTQPLAWTLSTADSAISGAGFFIVESLLFAGNSNTLPVLFTYDNITINGTPALAFTPGSVPTALAGILAGAQTWTPLFSGNPLSAITEQMPIIAGSTYRISLYALGVPQIKLMARPFDAAGVEQTTAVGPTETLTGAFQRFSWLWTPSAGQVSAYIGIQAQGTGAVTTTAWHVGIDRAALDPWSFGVGCPTVVVEPDIAASYWRAKFHRIKLQLREA